ncbi:MAG: DUF494 family protein [Desulfuromonas thiophila]|nr:DUF494 domain-containing protein [Desulfuromonas thiophila]MDY0397783.1 DUF494 family protein [Desulfuromonas thiophila]
MNERILILVGIIARHFLSGDDFSSAEEIVDELLEAGFDDDEIRQAFGWIEQISLQPASDSPPPLRQDPLRLFAPEEMRCLSRAARGFLIRLRRQGLLPPEIEEEVILRACLEREGKVGLSEVRSITALALFTSQRSDSPVIAHIIGSDRKRAYH